MPSSKNNQSFTWTEDLLKKFENAIFFKIFKIPFKKSKNQHRWRFYKLRKKSGEEVENAAVQSSKKSGDEETGADDDGQKDRQNILGKYYIR